MSGLAIGVLVILAVVAFLSLSHSPPKKTGKTGEPREPRRQASKAVTELNDTFKEIREYYEQEIAWLKPIWAERSRSKTAGEPQDPSWWWDEPSEAQLKRLGEGVGALRSAGMDFGFSPLTKGAASDLIGIGIDIDDDDKELLTFFKVEPAPKNQTRARYILRDLMKDPENQKAWESRPASREQIAVLKILGVEKTKALSAPQALRLRDDTIEQLNEEGDTKAQEVEAYESLIQKFTDKEECRERYLKKPSWTLLNQALDALREDGLTYQQMEEDDEVVEKKLLELKPSLERADD